MLQTTIGDLLDKPGDVTAYRLYVVKDGEQVLYVGQSSNIRYRIRGHLSRRGKVKGSLLGQSIHENEPHSRTWVVDLYTVEECSDLINKYFPYAPKVSTFTDEIRAMEDFAEDALIRHFAPRYNAAINIAAYYHAVPFENRQQDPYLQQRSDALRESRRQRELQQEIKRKERQEFLLKNVCTICGEHDTWRYSDGQPCGVLDLATVLVGDGYFHIPLVCHSCNDIINTLSALEKDPERVRKVKDAIERHKADELTALYGIE